MTHVVVIVADTLRFPWGSTTRIEPATMPFLSGEARHAQVMDRAVASSPWTVPSHLSLLTGLEPWNMHYHGPVLQVPSAPSLAGRWKEAGGETAAYSANGLVAPEYGLLREYETLNRYAVNRELAPKVWGALQPLTARWTGPADLVGTSAPPPSGPPRSSLANLPSRIVGSCTHAGVHFLTDGRGIAGGLDRYLRRRRPSRPLHLFLNLMETHEPYTLHPSSSTPPLPSGVFRPMMGLAPSLGLLRPWPAVRPLLERAYARSLAQLDARLRDLFGVMASRGLLHDAQVLLLSDHGQALGEGGFFGHGHSTQDEVSRIPCLRWSWERGERGAVPPDRNVDYFDHRHLHDALISGWERGGQPGDGASFGRDLDEARAKRGPAVCYWEGPDLGEVGRQIPDDRRHPPVRSLRLFRGNESLEATHGLVEEEGRVLFRPSTPAAPGSLGRWAEELLERTSQRSGSVPTTSEVVQERLRSWGYL